MKNNTWKAVELRYKGETMISIQQDYGQHDDPELAICGMWNVTDKSRQYAKLITAAPELLEALEDMIFYAKQGIADSGTIYIAECLIAKAKGEI